MKSVYLQLHTQPMMTGPLSLCCQGFCSETTNPQKALTFGGLTVRKLKVEVEFSNEGPPEAYYKPITSSQLAGHDRQNVEIQRRKKRSVKTRSHETDLQLAMLIPTEYIVVVVSFFYNYY